MATEEDQKAFEADLAPALKAIYKAAYNLTRNQEEAEDLVQEAAVRAFRAYYSFQQGTNFKAWFIRTLTNVFYGKYRKQQREPQITKFEDVSDLYLYTQAQKLHLGARNTDPAAVVLSRLDAETIGAALDRLPEEFRAVASMYFVDEFTYQEIADMLDCPIGTVRSRLHRARKLLQKALWELAEEQGILAALKAEEE